MDNKPYLFELSTCPLKKALEMIREVMDGKEEGIVQQVLANEMVEHYPVTIDEQKHYRSRGCYWLNSPEFICPLGTCRDPEHKDRRVLVGRYRAVTNSIVADLQPAIKNNRIRFVICEVPQLPLDSPVMCIQEFLDQVGFRELVLH